MKFTVIIILMAGILSSCNSDNSNKSDKNNKEPIMAENEYEIMFYNVENLFDTFDDPYTHDDDFLPNSPKHWDEDKFYTKLDRLSEVILSISKKAPLLVGMVEVENSYVLDQLINYKALKNINYKYAHFESPDERGIDVALLYNEDYFTLIDKDFLRVDLEDNDKTRDILYVQGKILGDDNSIYHIFVNHWPSRVEGQKKSEPKRISAAKTLRNKIDLIQDENPDAKIIVMGDFNDYPDSKSIRRHLKAKNSHTLTKKKLFNLAAKLDEHDKGSHNYRGDWGMLDQMMVSKSMLKKESGSFYLKQKGLQIFNENFIMYFDKKYSEYKPNKTYGGNKYYGGYSDHLPIHITIYKN